MPQKKMIALSTLTRNVTLGTELRPDSGFQQGEGDTSG